MSYVLMKRREKFEDMKISKRLLTELIIFSKWDMFFSHLDFRW